MQQFIVTGMSCAACSARVEKAVSKVEGVTSCSVSLLTNSMGVEGTAADQDIIQAVEAAGYGASVKGESSAYSGASSMAAEKEMLEDHDTPVLKRRLLASLGFLMVLMYFSMGHMMWGWPLPAFFEDNHIAIGAGQLLLTGIVMAINQKFFVAVLQVMHARATVWTHWWHLVQTAGLWLQYLCLVCHDGCPGEGRYGDGHALYA